MSESLDAGEVVPFRGFGVIDFKRNSLPNLISSSPNNQHQSPKEYRSMLISTCRLLRLLLIRCSNPVPLSIPVSSDTPAVIQSFKFFCSASKYYHHSISCSSIADRSRMVDSNKRVFAWAFKFHPKEGCSLDIQTPYVINWLIPCIPAKH